MERKFLEDLGLEKSAVDSIMVEHGKNLTASQTTVTDLTAENTTLKEQIATRDTDLKTLQDSNKNSDEVRGQLDDLKAKYEDQKAASALELTSIKTSAAIDLALTQNGAKNIKAVKSLLENDTIKFDEGGKLLGLSEQLTSLQKDEPYLFNSNESEASKPPHIVGGGSGDPSGAAGGKLSLRETIAANLAKK